MTFSPFDLKFTQHKVKLALLLSLSLLLSACDNGGGNASTPSNTAPTVANVSGTVTEDTPKAVTLLGTDANGNALTYAVVTAPLHGVVTVSGGTATYTPTLNYHGTDSFTYKANDGTVDSATATVSITVTPVNDAPTANAASATTAEDTVKTLTLVGMDVDGDTLTYTKVTDSTHGTVTLNGNIATYTPTLNSNGSGTIGDAGAYTGSDTFTFTVNDGTVDAATATVSIAVTPVNDAPIADPFGETAEAGVAKSFDLRGSDVDNLVITRTAAITVPPQYGTATLSGLRVTYTPNISYSGTDTLKYTLSDGIATSNEAQVTLLVSPNPVVQPSPTGKLNDTGITACGDNTQNGLLCPQLTHSGQDGNVGRDVTDNDGGGDGHAGFSFTKIGANGHALALQTEAYNESGTEVAGTKWSCVKDNVTGLIWEVKTDDDGLHGKDWTYTWYDTNATTNGGDSGTANGGSCGSPATSQCDTSGYVAAINAAGWCGANDWRMPTVDELSGIAQLDRYQYPATDAPAIDTYYFPNTTSTVAAYGEYAVFWSSSPNVISNGDEAWGVDFDSGSDSPGLKNVAYQVRLVRSGQ